ncbi:MAG: hypothetical protein HKO79_12455 [Desulfobacterales bacterium]|nr:hypothetical protein [Deltaproteobacteria bacterium]NNL43292.1 hypothetical protein [Desulfobacterales bacterium]
MSNLKQKHLIFFILFFALTYFSACVHQQQIDPKDTNVEVWELKLSGQTEGKLEMLMKRDEIGEGIYSIIGKISGTIDDHRGGLGDADYKFNGKIENNAFSIHLGGHSEMAEGPSSIIGKLNGIVELSKGSGQWVVTHALGSSTGKYVMVKLR